ncbi:MAG: HAD family hydrolase [Methylophilaceae bacterium]|nr:HAD family hydrolase [Methylophilaceae bacterium]
MSQYWIFDFDGTLIDSEPAIKECYVKITKGLAPSRTHVAENIQIGPTLNDTSIEILGKKFIHLLSEFKESFVKEYDDKIILETLIYPNTDIVLKKLYERGDKIAIATNKRSAPTKKLIEYFGWSKFFEWIACSDEFPHYKNKSEIVMELLKNHKSFIESFYVGDTYNDGVTANNNNLKFIRATYGYGRKEDWSNVSIYNDISKIEEILEL